MMRSFSKSWNCIMDIKRSTFCSTEGIAKVLNIKPSTLPNFMSASASSQLMYPWLSIASFNFSTSLGFGRTFEKICSYSCYSSSILPFTTFWINSGEFSLYFIIADSKKWLSCFKLTDGNGSLAVEQVLNFRCLIQGLALRLRLANSWLLYRYFLEVSHKQGSELFAIILTKDCCVKYRPFAWLSTNRCPR